MSQVLVKMDLNNKIIILRLIFDNKEVLFGKLTNQLTPEIKISKWKEIAAHAIQLGIFHKDWKYLRDTTWQNWRKRTLEKRENHRRSGGEGKKIKYDDADELILKILGLNPPVVERLLVPEQSLFSSTQVNLQKHEETPLPRPCPPLCPTLITPRVRVGQGIPKRSLDTKISTNMMTIKIKKMELELELAKEKLEIANRERYKLDLELLKLERELDIKDPSKYTLPFHQQKAIENDETINYDINYDELRHIHPSSGT